MDLTVWKSASLKGTAKLPPNKSHSFRALIMASLAEGVSKIIAPAVSNDWMRGIEALEMLGSTVSPKAEQVWEVTGVAGKLKTPEDILDCGNSGIILRFFTALASCCGGYTVLTGDHSLRFIRPCQPLLEAINHLGGWAVSTKGDGHAPVVVRGHLKGGRCEIDGADSQPISALLIATSLADAPSDIIVSNPGEKPWVAMTLDWLTRCGVEFSNDNYTHYRIRGRSVWKGFDFRVPLDWSAALYPIAAAVLSRDSEVTLPGLDFADSQGDKGVITILQEMGARIDVTPEGVTARSSQLKGRTIDCNDFIDQFMLLAVVGACAEGETVLTNAEICRHKECDRISEMAKALKIMGAEVQERPDGLMIRRSRLRGAEHDSRNDHRMVMTLAVAGMVAEGKTLIKNIDCVKKTFPEFVHQMQCIGAELQVD
ncbi:MAG: 3-phosphoshikimate 1-carboxyvinyltransferase [Planctomycetaceae bacterium]|nr:3-phosphoshikimate 1-carboxyvinyltransferase [Planctomycetaceae bacterium]